MTQRHLIEPDLNRIGYIRGRRSIVREQTHLPNRIIRLIQNVQSRTPLRFLAIVEFAQIKKLTFHHAAFGADTFNDTPVPVFLPVFEPPVTLQVHDAIFP
jgi:hypothetical protein